MRSASSDVNRLIREMGSTIRVANPRAESEYQLFDEANGLVLGLDQVGSGTGQMVAVANRISRASTKSAEHKRYGSGRYPLALIQEPEAHLHPRKQADIGEVICRQAVTHPMRLLIETHSDALLFRCLKLIRRGTIDHDAMRVIYVEQAQDGTSTARNLRIGEDGALIDPFPVGFLDWGLEDLLGQ
jgi:predicted ATP-dependent endonuclease of OLD family